MVGRDGDVRTTLPGEILGPTNAQGTQSLPLHMVFEQPRDRLAHALGIAQLDIGSGLPGHFGERRSTRQYDRDSAGHGL
ncbi:hypothetical protein D9M68_1004200 [compost metagenome]